MVVRELITRLGFWFNGSQAAQAEKRTQQLKDRANEASTAFRNIALAIASIATVKAIINITDEMQSMRTRVGMLPQTIGDAADAFNVVVDRASAAGMSIEAYGKLYTRIGNAAKDYIDTQEDLLGITDTISQALVVGGASAQEASSAMIQFSQALGSGVLQGDEFRAMAEAAPQYLDKLSETMGIPRDQLKKMASEGKLTSKAVIEATRQMSDYFTDKFKQMPMTVGRAVTIIGNRFAKMLDKMNQDAGFIDTISRAMLAGFTAIENGVKWLVDIFDGWGNVIRYIGIAIGVALGAKTILILHALGAAGAKSLITFTLIAAAILLVAAAVEDLYIWIEGGDSLIGSLIGPWVEWRSYVMSSVEGVVALFNWVGSVIAAVGAILVGAFTLDLNLFIQGLNGLGEALFGKLLEWGSAIYNTFYNAIAGALSAAWDAVTGRIGQLWQMAKNFVGAGGAGEGAAPGVTAAGMVTPAQVAGDTSRPNISANTNVNVTVPPGTTAEQAAFLQKTAQQSFSAGTDANLANAMTVYAP